MIVILGDSWGVGEWGLYGQLTGPGLGQYFSLHGKVINLSEGGSNNFRQAAEFNKLLTKFTPDQDDTFYWIVSDPLRDIDPNSVTITTIEQFARSQLDIFLHTINTTAAQYNIVVNLIGGLCDLNTVDVDSYNNIKIAVPSWGQLLSEDYSTSIFCDQCLAKWGTQLQKHLLDEWIDITDQALQKRKSVIGLESKKLMQEDHPTRQAHILLRNFLCPEFAYKF
jgi:hypothetical protein